MQNTMGSKMLFSLARRCGTVDRQPDSGKRERERERTAWRTHIERGQVEDDVIGTGWNGEGPCASFALQGVTCERDISRKVVLEQKETTKTYTD